jgi:hypothetical protein
MTRFSAIPLLGAATPRELGRSVSYAPDGLLAD